MRRLYGVQHRLFLMIMICLLATCAQAARRPLNILFVVGLFPKRTETFILNQITRLIDRGHNVWIHSYVRGKMHEACDIIKRYNLFKRTTYGEWCPKDVRKFDILYCQFGMMGNKMLRQKERVGSKAKLVTCFRGYDMTRQLKKYPDTYKKLMKKGDLFLPVCDYFAKELVNLGADPAKIKVHHSALDLALFSYVEKVAKHMNDTINIISVSRLIEKKGIEYALRAVAYVVKKYPHIHYTIVGGGPLQSTLEELVVRLKLEKNVTMTGSLPHEQAIQQIHSSDIMVLPSVVAQDGNQEGIPNVLKEAMACGLPVISTYHAGIPELVAHNVSGLLVKQRNVPELVRALVYLIEHQDMWHRMGAEGRKKIEKEYNVDFLIEKLENYFYALLDK